MREKYIQAIYDFMNQTSLNKVPELGIENIFDQPLIGFAAAIDPLFIKLKEPNVIGSHHKLPTEWLAEGKTIISYFLPFSEKIRTANYNLGLPATEWVYARIDGEGCNEALRQHLVNLVKEQGGKAIAPALEPEFKVIEKRSNWSERHVAYIAGLGTFGLSRSLITTKGCAGRYGSVIISFELEPTPRSYVGLNDYCTMCLDCIARCPSGAITPAGKNVLICSEYQDTVVKPKFHPRYGCGKCQTNVPCEFALP